MFVRELCGEGCPQVRNRPKSQSGNILFFLAVVGSFGWVSSGETDFESVGRRFDPCRAYQLFRGVAESTGPFHSRDFVRTCPVSTEAN